MKLKGISDKGISRIARSMKSQDLGGPDYEEFEFSQAEPEKYKRQEKRELEQQNRDINKWGDASTVINSIKKIFKKAKAEWTDDGWIVEGDLYLYKLGLTKLPMIKFVGGSFDCRNNNLTSLEGGPEEVGGGFSCIDNELVSLEGTPLVINGDFDCSWNQLTSLEGGPEEVYGDFWCSNNPVEFTEEDVRTVCNVSGKINSISPYVDE